MTKVNDSFGYSTGSGNPLTKIFKFPIIKNRAPATTDINYRLGQQWINPSTSSAWVLASVAGGSAVWIAQGSGATGGVVTIQGDSGGAESPLAGNFNLRGTANQIAVTGTANTETFSLIGPYTPSTYTSHGVLIGAGTSSITALTVGTNGQVLLGSTGDDPVFGTLTSSTIAFTPGAGSLALDVKSGGFIPAVISGTSQAMSVQTSYIANNAAQTTFTLPVSGTIGDTLRITGSNLNVAGFKITYGTSQIIWGPGGSSTVTSGSATSAAAAAQSVTLQCIQTDTTWAIISNSGTISLT